MHRRKNASRQLAALRKEIERRQKQRYREWVGAACSSESFQSRAERLLNKRASIDSKEFFEKAIRRYLTAKVRNATWSASLGLLEYLAFEWLRDDRALWRFLDAAFVRWKDLLKNPKSVRRRSIVIHQLFGSQFSLDECKKRGISQSVRLQQY